MFDPKKLDYPDPSGRVDSVGYPEIWYLDHRSVFEKLGPGDQHLYWPYKGKMWQLYIRPMSRIFFIT